MRNKTFFTLADLNWDIRDLLHRLNDREFNKLPGSRRSWFESLEKETLLPLPERRYEISEWKKARVNIDYHVELNRHYNRRVHFKDYHYDSYRQHKHTGHQKRRRLKPQRNNRPPKR